MLSRALTASKKTLRRAAVIALGSAVLCFGILLIVLPGPALIVIPVGLAILGLEFAWARRWQAVVRSRAREAYHRIGRISRSAERPVPRRSY